ncbi:TIGR02206 family membrane protein [Virgibacillus oceani]
MENWFGGTAHEGFTLFSTGHIFMIILYFVVLIALLYSYKKATANPSFRRTLRWSFAGFLLFLEITYQTWMVANDMWHPSHSLPLQICSLAFILAAIALVTLNKSMIVLTFFLGFIPAGLTIITPELNFDFPHYRYWHFFLQHIVLSLVSLYLVLAHKVKITFKTTMAAFGALLLYALVIGVFINPMFGGNYLFLSDSPENETLINFLGTGVIYIVNLVIAGFVVFLISFGIYKMVIRRSEG